MRHANVDCAARPQNSSECREAGGWQLADVCLEPFLGYRRNYVVDTGGELPFQEATYGLSFTSVWDRVVRPISSALAFANGISAAR